MNKGDKGLGSRSVVFSRFASGTMLLFGVILPVITLGFELATQGCADLLFDPIPTYIHVLLVALVPISNLLILWVTWSVGQGTQKRWMRALSGASIFVSGLYTVAFLPVTHVAAIGVLYFGFGLIPLTPLISFVVCLFLWRRLRRWRALNDEEEQPNRFFSSGIVGAIGAFALLGLLEMPRVATIYGVRQATSNSESAGERGIWLLRLMGDREMLLDDAMGQSQRIWFRWGDTWGGREQARRLYYRVTGEPFNSRPLQERGLFDPFSARSWDQDLGGTQVGQRLDDVYLIESRLGGVLYPEEGSGYVEWTMVFRNDNSGLDREARFVLRPPKDGVVSRVTLWVNGEPREAAFDNTFKVREAYQEVAVRQRLDPLLVTSLGPDLVLVQCFPIPPASGEMKIRIGMSFPLNPAEPEWQSAPLPMIADQNFRLEPGLQHSLWYESEGTMKMKHPWLARAKGLQSESDLRLLLDDDEYRDSAGIAVLGEHIRPLLGYSPVNEQYYLVERTPQEQSSDSAVFAVVDGSADMAEHAERIGKWLSRFPEATVWFAGDRVEKITGAGADVAEQLARSSFKGGQDSVPALSQALSETIRRGDESNTVLHWFYGDQPVLLSSPDQISQYYERGNPGVTIVACPMWVVVNRLRERPPLEYAATGYGSNFAWQSWTATPIGLEQQGTKIGQAHLFRAAFARELRQDLLTMLENQGRFNRGDYQEQMKAFAKEASELQLVTLVTGAVVLETAQQYEDNDLEPVDPDTVPSVPEPAQAALIMGLVMFGALAVLKIRRRRAR
ncbi:MAG: VIT domain-containing protein [Verrucomicrobiota bacterium]